MVTGEVVTPLYCRRETQSDPAPLTTSRTFCGAAKICREFLSTFLAGPVLDSLSESARLVAASPSLPLGTAQGSTQRISPLWVSLGLWAVGAFGCVSSNSIFMI